MKPPNIRKIPNKGVTNLRDRKLKNNKLKLGENKQKVRENCSRQFPMSRLEFLDVIGFQCL